MSEFMHAEFVLTRGPEALQRRLPLHVPIDGTYLSVGRASDNDVVLDPHLFFASNRHCMLYARTKTAAEGNKAEDAMIDAVTDKRRPNAGKRSREQQERELCLIDVGSSNGTFINGIRIESGVSTPLTHGDVIVLGGLRDIEVGASMPSDEMVQEIVTWRIAFNIAGGGEEFEFEATPPVFPRVDFVEEEQKRLTLALLHSVHRSPQRVTSDHPADDTSPCVISPPPADLKRGDGARQRQEQHGEGSSRTPAVQEVVRPHEDDGAANVRLDMEVSTERNPTVSAQVTPRARKVGSSSPTAPFAAPFRAVRVGSHSFIVPLTYETPTKLKRSRGGDSSGSNTNQRSSKGNTLCPHTLSITHADWKWTRMDVATGAAKAKRRSSPDCVIPWSSVARIMYCTSHHGLTVELHRGVDLPLAGNHKVTEDMSFITWLVGAAKEGGASTASADAAKAFERLIHHIHCLCLKYKWPPTPHPVEEATFLSHYAPAA